MNKQTHSIYIQDHIKGWDHETFFQSLTAAAKHLDTLHQWARDNGYKPTDYTLTLNEI